MTASVPRFETHTRYCALGLRCWDPVFDSAVVQGLNVKLRRKDGTGGWQHAVQTPNGHFSFHGLKGLHEYETTGKLPDQLLPFELYVEDSLGRFLPTLRVLDLPWTGEPPLLSSQTPARLEYPARGLMLFTAPTRQLPDGVELIVGDLWDSHNKRPAAHAKLVAEVDGVEHYAVADKKGIVRLPLHSLPPSRMQWDVNLSACYQALSGDSYNGSNNEPLPPDQADILTQASALLEPVRGGDPLISMDLRLPRGRTLILQTLDEAENKVHPLWIRPQGQ